MCLTEPTHSVCNLAHVANFIIRTIDPKNSFFEDDDDDDDEDNERRLLLVDQSNVIVSSELQKLIRYLLSVVLFL